MIFTNAALVLPDRILPGGSLRVQEGTITETSQGRIDPVAREEVVDLRGQYLAPGFIDLHIHGAQHRDAMEATPHAFDTICRFHAAGGTTALALTTITAPAADILAVLGAVENYRPTALAGAQVLGVHIEGPYFSLAKPGAHKIELIRHPEPAEYEQFLAHQPVITQMTLAPELPGALPLIERLTEAGIRASGGHSDAWDEEARAACERGLRQVTHTYNCMSSARRRGPYRVAGLLEFALSEPRILCELIADDRHVSQTLMRMLYRAKGGDGIALVTDATAGAGLAEGEEFSTGEIKCVVRGQVGMTSNGQALAGSTATMIGLVRNMVELVGVPLVEAIRMATLNPAKALGREKSKGQLIAGADADLVVLTAQLEVAQTLVRGQRVYPAGPSAPS